MSINRTDAQRRLTAALMAWRGVAAARATQARVDSEIPPAFRLAGVHVTDGQLDALADGFDLMAALWTELEDLTRQCDIAAHGITTEVKADRVELTAPREDGRAPTTLKMDGRDAIALGGMLVKAGQRSLLGGG